ncbi:hypothetical protein B0J18DRAFT_396797 [Chaetomium sp. MPI-SDFR-AT-0129]|nr:hypothetical protein B0J18DRAFT_396797 [Chaetomium sp. MPI-SDFR-AT-0129]
MGQGSVSWARVLLLGLLAPLSAADSSDGLAYEAIDKNPIFTSNLTQHAARTPLVDGWWDSKICSGDFCVFTNRRLGKGRGLVAVTKLEEAQKLEQLENHFDNGENKYFDDPAPFTTTDIPYKGPGITATKTIRRGKPLMVWSPVLLVHKALFNQVPKKKERTRLLETAVSYLPDATRAIFNRQRIRPGDDTAHSHPRSIEDILLAHPFEIDLGHVNWQRVNDNDNDVDAHSKHYVNYPEVSAMQHDCRPNVATHLDNSFALRATVARRVQQGEELTVSYIDPFLPREERTAWVKRYRGYGVPGGEEGGVHNGCPCKACSPDAGTKGEKVVAGDERLEEILKLRAILRNHDSRNVDFPMIERFVKLCEEERLHIRFAEMYELAALNFNYLGDDKRAKKYAEYAVQAGIVEGGLDSNDAIAMRVMAKDVKGHYSYRFTLKRRGE